MSRQRHLLGGTNGMLFFDPTDDKLWVARVIGPALSKIDPATGDILEQLTGTDSVWFPEDES